MAEPSELALIRANAEAGDVQAQVRLGWALFAPGPLSGIRRNRKQGLHWLKQAASSGQPRAITRLAWALLDYPAKTENSRRRYHGRGIGLLQDMAGLQQPLALLRLAVELDKGENLPRDRGEALVLIEKAASLGNRLALVAKEKLSRDPDWRLNKAALAMIEGNRRRLLKKPVA